MDLDKLVLRTRRSLRRAGHPDRATKLNPNDLSTVTSAFVERRLRSMLAQEREGLADNTNRHDRKRERRARQTPK
jgi:hypothetical protein